MFSKVWIASQAWVVLVGERGASIASPPGSDLTVIAGDVIAGDVVVEAVGADFPRCLPAPGVPDPVLPDAAWRVERARNASFSALSVSEEGW